MGVCSVCGLGLTKTEEVAGICFKCEQKERQGVSPDEMRRRQREADRQREEGIKGMMLTTEAYPMGLNIERRIEVVTAECVFGMNLFRDFFAGVRDIVGGRSAATQKVLRDARRKVLDELKEEAFEVGANGVIGVALSYSEISGDGKSMLFVVASGTAVKLGAVQ